MGVVGDESATGGDPACWAHLVCPECGAVEGGGHRDGCLLGDPGDSGPGPSTPDGGELASDRQMLGDPASSERSTSGSARREASTGRSA